MSVQNDSERATFSDTVGHKAARKERAMKRDKQSVWMGLGMFGMVGWSVAVPTLLGATLGQWLDTTHPQTFSWTLTLLITGLFVGCMIAGHWIVNEHKQIHKDENG